MTSLRNAGMFRRGVSGNPGGRPKTDPSIKQYCVEKSPAIVRAIAGIALNLKAKHSDRIRAAEIILERAYGKPIQPSRDLGQGESYAEFLKSLDE